MIKKMLSITLLATTLYSSSYTNSNILEKRTEKAVVTFNLSTIYKLDYTIIATENGLKIYSDGYDNTLPLIFLLFGNECPPCQAELEQLKKLVKENRVNVIGIECQGLGLKDGKFDLKKATPWLRMKELNFDVASLDEPKNMNLLKFIESQIKWDGTIPTMMLFNKEGSIKRVVSEALTEKQFEDFLSIVEK